MTRPTQLAYLCHMRDALAAVREHSWAMMGAAPVPVPLRLPGDVFFASPMIEDAVLRNLEVLGQGGQGT
jgi:hypothetical protein